MKRYSNIEAIIVLAFLCIGLAWACATTGYNAIDAEYRKYDKQREDLEALKRPINYTESARNATIWDSMECGQ